MGAIARGTILADTYEIIEEIGAGGGGIVFRARHLRLQTDVVVKKIKDEIRGKVKLRQEADILKRLKHPYLPRVYDFIETADGVYTVMDFIHGVDLDTALKKHGRCPQKQVRKWAEQLGEALAYLHSQKPPIIHSDIKPANIMLTKDGDVCLIDFNISLAMGGTMESAVGISAGFSPPEQYRDPALYARITHAYTMQKSMQVSQAPTPQPSVADDDATEILAEGQPDATRQPSWQGGYQPGTGGIPYPQQDAGQPGVDTSTMALWEEQGQTGNSQASWQVGYSQPGTTSTVALWEEAGQQPDRYQAADGTEILRTGTAATSAQASGNLPGYTQYIGKGIDARSDIYSLGITLYALLTGAPPSLDFGQRVPIGETRIRISEGFAVILEKMMELSPDLRYQNGGEYLKAIRNCHKFDHRYVVMHRKQTGIQIAALSCLALGIVTVFGGLYVMRKEQNSAYYACIAQAGEKMELSDFEEADRLLSEAKELSDTRIDAYEEEIRLLYLSGNYEECMKLGENYINTQPFLMESEEDEKSFGNLYFLVGNACFELEDYPNAGNLFMNAIEYNAENGLYYRDYAITLAKLGQVDEAQTQLEKGISLGLGQDSIYMAQGEIARVRGEYEDAINYLQQTIDTTVDQQMKKRAVLLSRDVYRTIGNEAIDQEIALLEQYRQQYESSGDLVMAEYLAEAYARKARADEAQADTYNEKALTLFRGIYDSGRVTYQLQQNMAILYEDMERFDEAEELLLQMAESYPQRYEVYKRLAYLEADRQQSKENEERDYSRMREYYEKAKEKYDGQPDDMEMQMLDSMMQELEDGGWFS